MIRNYFYLVLITLFCAACEDDDRSNDNSTPILILNGDYEVFIKYGNDYIELGASAEDDTDIGINDKVIIGGDVVDVFKTGTYVVTYDVTDKDNNKAKQVERIVKVIIDRSSVLANLTDNIVLPSYNAFRSALGDFKSVANAYVNDPSEINLTTVKEHWLAAYKLWQHVEMFDIGKAEEINFNQRMNAYRTNTTLIEANIESGNYDLSADNEPSYLSQGFPAMDYLLFGLETGVLGGASDKYRNYLEALVDEMISNTDLCIADWNANRDAFVSDATNTATSSFNKLTNDFIYYYEKGLRANKVGIPAGYFGGFKFPNFVEAYYKQDVSKVLLLEAMTATENFFLGKKYGTEQTGESFKTYLETLDAETELPKEITDNYEAARQQIAKLQDNFVIQIKTNNLEFLRTFDAIQKNVPKFKVHMLQAFKISPDYADADGD